MQDQLKKFEILFYHLQEETNNYEMHVKHEYLWNMFAIFLAFFYLNMRVSNDLGNP